jgi:DNA-binding response OmpR family regulator
MISDGGGEPRGEIAAEINQNDLCQCRDLGADDYISKPFQALEILEVVEACLAKNSQ